MNFNLKNIKTAKSRNGFSMSALFLINDTVCANFVDKGDGSEPTFYITPNDQSKKLFNEFEAAIEVLPEIYIEQYGMDLKIDKGFFIDILHAALVNKTEFKLLAAC